MDKKNMTRYLRERVIKMTFEEWWMKQPYLEFRNEYIAALEAWDASHRQSEEEITHLKSELSKAREEIEKLEQIIEIQIDLNPNIQRT